ncbi:MAG: proliferating cell nuclear antigen (pcna) [Euryarchaeota archaeon]|nr:proliferating cell nuclear antigen (pcna) [Euryarchaeota archaeon]
MFKASLSDPKILKSSIDAISNLIDEAGITVDESGMKLRAMDPAHVALVDFELSKDAFDEFEVKESAVIGLDLDRFNTILKRAGSADKISMSLEDSALRVRFKNTSTRTFNIPLIDVSEEELKIPALEFGSVVEIDPRMISEGIKDAEIVSDHVTFKTDQDAFYILAKGDLGNVEITIKKEDTISFEVTSEAESMFSIEYLKDMIKASEIADSATVSLGANIPVKMDFAASNAKLSFLLAPRIESD